MLTVNHKLMEQEFDATLTGSDSPIEGIARRIYNTGYLDAYDFKSIDETIHLVIAQQSDEHWIRIGGTDPYLTGWIDELAEQANQNPKLQLASSAKKRHLGNSDIRIKPFVLGCNVFGWTIDQSGSFRVLDAFIDSGFDFVDTADTYSKWAPGNHGGESETIIGNWLSKRGHRDDVIIATKVGKPMAEDKKGLSARYIKQAVEASLTRLRTDYIDLYQSHDDDQTTPLQETMEAYTQLINEGKVRAIGASNYSAERLKEALEISKNYGLATYQSLQPEYNLYDRDHFETELKPLCLEQQIGVISYYALASGFLTGKYRNENDLNKSKRGKGVKKYLNDRGFRILNAVDKIAKDYNSTPAAVSLAWIMARPGITAPIASATSTDQLRELISATELNLSQEAMDLLNQVSSY